MVTSSHGGRSPGSYSNEYRVPKPMGADVGDVFCCTSRKIVVEKIGNLEWRKHHRSSSWKHLSFWGMTKLGVPTLALDSPSSVRAAQSWFAATWQLSGLEGPAWKIQVSKDGPAKSSSYGGDANLWEKHILGRHWNLHEIRVGTNHPRSDIWVADILSDQTDTFSLSRVFMHLLK